MVAAYSHGRTKAGVWKPIEAIRTHRKPRNSVRNRTKARYIEVSHVEIYDFKSIRNELERKEGLYYQPL